MWNLNLPRHPPPKNKNKNKLMDTENRLVVSLEVGGGCKMGEGDHKIKTASYKISKS